MRRQNERGGVRLLVAAVFVMTMPGCSDSPTSSGVSSVPTLVRTVTATGSSNADAEFTEMESGPDGTVYATRTQRGGQSEMEITVIAPTGDPVGVLILQGADLAVTAAGVATTSQSDRILRRYAHSGELLLESMHEGPETGNFLYDYPVALSPDGVAFVADTLRRLILRQAPDGQWLSTWGRRGTGPGDFEHVTDLECDADGNLILLDGDLWRLQKFTPEGEVLWVREIERSVQFGAPMRAAISVTEDGRIGLVDWTFYPGRVTLFSPEGVIEHRWDVPEFTDLGDVRSIILRADGEVLLGGFDLGGVRRLSSEGDDRGLFLPVDLLNTPGRRIAARALLDGENGELLLFFHPSGLAAYLDRLSPEGEFGERIELTGFPDRSPDILIRLQDGRFLGGYLRGPAPTYSSILDEFSPTGQFVRRPALDFPEDAEIENLASGRDGGDYCLIFRVPRTGHVVPGFGSDVVLQKRSRYHGELWSVVIPTERTSLGESAQIVDLQVAPNGDIYVIDAAENIFRYRSDGRDLGRFEGPAGSNALRSPTRLQVDPDGFLHVSGTRSRGITVLAPTGTFVGRYFEEEPGGSLGYRLPHRFRILSDGTIWVQDGLGRRLFAYSR